MFYSSSEFWGSLPSVELFSGGKSGYPFVFGNLFLGGPQVHPLILLVLVNFGYSQGGLAHYTPLWDPDPLNPIENDNFGTPGKEVGPLLGSNPGPHPRFTVLVNFVGSL